MASKTKDRTVMQITMFRIRFHLTVASLLDFPQGFPHVFPELVDRRGSSWYFQADVGRQLRARGLRQDAEDLGNQGFGAGSDCRGKSREIFPAKMIPSGRFYGDLMIFDGELMGFYGDLMICDGDLMGFL